MCGNLRCRHILTLELYHMIPVHDGGPTTASDLIALCPSCHALHGEGKISQTAIRHWKGMLVALNQAFGRQSMDLLLFLHKTGPNSLLWYSADGVLRFVALVAAGLVCSGQQATGSVGNIPASSHRLDLSEKGRQVVESWEAGDEDAYRRLIGEHGPNTTTR